MTFSPGALIHLRDREWIVLPSADPDVLRIRPLGGHDIETTGIYLPLALPDDTPRPATFERPGVGDLADFESARLLYDAARLALRTGAGPFRSFGRLSVRPRAYQLVPLILALRQEIVRLLIADDVGIGKTIEALLIARELHDRGLIQRFAVICPPHLCDQWQRELLDKFGFEAEVIRSDTAAALDRRIHGDASVFRFYPFQVISIDYIKSDTRRQGFLAECPELVIIDEAHTCARPPGANVSQQQRHRLLHDISRKAGQHLLLLTATPHSGIQESFQSLLGMLHPDFAEVEISEADQTTRRRLARHFVQRRRGDIVDWIDHTDFPERETRERSFSFSERYHQAFLEVLRFAQGYARQKDTTERKQRMRYWTALGLLRGVGSSPAAGAKMLRNRADRIGGLEEVDGEEDRIAEGRALDDETMESDVASSYLTEAAEFKSSECRELNRLADLLETLKSLEEDLKAASLLAELKSHLRAGFFPIVFCRYIQTADYLAELLKPHLEKAYPGILVESVTSELNDEQRRERVEEMARAPRRVLIATDCLSEGINLQEAFTAVLHYDLPWNPNRLEQREGRIDRFGQTAPLVRTTLLVGAQNPVDGVVVRVLLRKAQTIRRQTGVSLPFPEDSKTVTAAVTNAVLLNPDAYALQLTLGFEAETIARGEQAVERALEEVWEREKKTRSIFAQHSLKPADIEPDLRETDEALGDPRVVERFIRQGMAFFGVQMDPMREREAYRLYPGNLRPDLKDLLPKGDPVKVSFHSPVPKGCHYLGRNHPFVEQTCRFLLRLGFDPTERLRPARAAVVRTRRVAEKTTVVLLRVRNVIADARGRGEIVAEEVITWGYRGMPEEGRRLTAEEGRDLLLEVTPSSNVSPQEQSFFLTSELELLADLEERFADITRERTERLIEAHARYRAAIGGESYFGVEPVWPPDMLGLYLLIPDRTALET